MELDAIKSVLSSSIDPNLETTDYRLKFLFLWLSMDKTLSL